jgi:RNA polymerase sigma-70 factor, ECF subfamily
MMSTTTTDDDMTADPTPADPTTANRTRADLTSADLTSADLTSADLTDDGELAREFTQFRPRLLGIAYRLLGSAWDAEDVVAEAMVRWMRVDRREIREPLAFLTTVVTRLALDQLRSARATRETYVGEWLPEPVPTDPSILGPLDTVERREAVSLATLRMMEALTPPERAVLVLHEAFEMTHAEIAGVLDITEQGARQHLHRARTRVHRTTAPATPEVHDAQLSRFLAALEAGDLGAVQDLLAADVAAYADGGGRARAARTALVGADKVFGFFAALRRHMPVTVVRRVDVNGRPAALLQFGRQRLLLALEVRDGRIREIHSVINPAKLAYLDRRLAQGTSTTRPKAWRLSM